MRKETYLAVIVDHLILPLLHLGSMLLGLDLGASASPIEAAPSLVTF